MAVKVKSEVESLTRKGNALGKSIRNDLGERVLVFIDAGPVICAENYARDYRHAIREMRAIDYFDALDRSPGIRLCTCPEVYDEIKRHTLHTRNGFPEISQSSADYFKRLSNLWCSFSESAAFGIEIDAIRRDVYWIDKLVFADNPKKGEVDPMSHTDRALVSQAISAIGLRSGPGPSPFANSKGLSGVAVLTTDAHVHNTISALSGPSKLNGGSFYDGVKSYRLGF